MMTGRELDAMIAERIMGLNVVAKDWPCGPNPSCGEYEAAGDQQVSEGDIAPWHDEEGPVYVSSEFEYDGKMYRSLEPVPFYSIKIQWAWTVVEKLNEKDVSCSLKRYAAPHPDFLKEAPCSCLLYNFDYRVLIFGETAPEAICKAAIKWMEDRTDA